MELRELAERILFGTTLDEKLATPAIITDARPGSALLTPEMPGRPPELRFKPTSSGKADFPGAHRLEKESERGKLLHFFANHELLATELMALVLLKFPDAPAAFRRGVLQTLKDEQDHTRLYLERMRQCGIAFGEIPVSGYFWRAVSAMETPLDYVTGLSLTFEQGNLDFCRHFARGFSMVGDEATAKLLERIYRDEIGHVAYGLKWFRRWKNPRQNDWNAFCRQLKFPLSPQRAKGITLNVEGRRAAGLDAEFINELNVYSHSKGRTPSVFVFNPFAEGYIAHGKRFSPVKHQMMLAADLENLPQFLCRRDDVVLVTKRPSVEFLSSIKDAGFPLPEFVEAGECRSETSRLDLPNSRAGSAGVLPASCRMADGRTRRRDAGAPRSLAMAIQNLARRKLGGLRPWAWGPDSLEILGPLFASVSGETRAEEERFNEGIAQLYSKAWSVEFLKTVLRTQPGPAGDRSWLCDERDIGVAIETLDDALAAIDAIRRRGHHKVVVKQAFGLAGQNAVRLWEPALLEKQRRWIADSLQDGRRLVVEPWLEREMDFSVQLEMTPGSLKLRGYTGLINDLRGQFQGNWAEPNFARRVPARALTLLRGAADVSSQIDHCYGSIVSLLETELKRAGHLGPLGIDAFLYRDSNGKCRLKPIVEINPRYTMGRLTLELMSRVRPGRRGVFRLINRAMIREQGFTDFPSYARRLEKQFPMRLEGSPVPKLATGTLCLNDPAQAQVSLAMFHVDPSASRFPKDATTGLLEGSLG